MDDDIDNEIGAEPQTFYYRHADGSYSSRTVEGVEEEIVPPDGAVEITQAEYEAGVAAIDAANAQALADLQAAEQARAREDYEALLAAGVPEATARRMSGYTGEAGPSA